MSDTQLPTPYAVHHTHDGDVDYYTADQMRAYATEAVRAALAAQGEPFGYFRAEPFGWTDCAKDDEGAIALYTAPPAPAKPMTDEQPVSNPDELPKGFVPLQRENGKLVYAACLDGGRYHGWLMWKHPDGQWVTKRKMTSLEVMQAEDQDHYGIVQDAHHGITDKGGA